jgi:hypothetical protein
MLPEVIHKDDVKWLQQQLVTIPLQQRVTACIAYSKVWQAAHDAEPMLHCKENAGRFAANSRLRAYVKKVHVALNQ